MRTKAERRHRTKHLKVRDVRLWNAIHNHYLQYCSTDSKPVRVKPHHQKPDSWDGNDFKGDPNRAELIDKIERQELRHEAY